MNIHILSNASNYGGSERSMELLASEISKNIVVLVYAENENHINNLKSNGVKTIAFNKGKSIYVTCKNIFIFLRRINKKSIIVANTNKAAFYIAIMNKFGLLRENRKIIFVRDFQWQYKKFIKNNIKSNALYCIPSEACREYVNFFTDHAQIIVDPVSSIGVNNINNNDNFEYKNYIVCPAMISRWKGIDLLIKSFSRIRSDIKLIIVGKVLDLEFYEEIKKLVKDLKLEKKIIFLEFTNNMQVIYQNSLFVVNTSISKFGGPETFGRTIIEAWQFNKTVISFACGGPKYIIEDGVDGILVDEYNLVKFAESIDFLVENKDIRCVMENNGMSKALSEFSIDKVIEKLTKFF